MDCESNTEAYPRQYVKQLASGSLLCDAGSAFNTVLRVIWRAGVWGEREVPEGGDMCMPVDSCRKQHNIIK